MLVKEKLLKIPGDLWESLVGFADERFEKKVAPALIYLLRVGLDAEQKQQKKKSQTSKP